MEKSETLEILLNETWAYIKDFIVNGKYIGEKKYLQIYKVLRKQWIDERLYERRN